MVTYLKMLIFSQTGKNTGIVFIGTLVNIITAGLFFIFVPRILGPADYGLFSTIISTGMMAAAFANFGLDTGILRFASQNSLQTNSVLTLAFKSYLISGLATSLIGFLLAPYLAKFLELPQITPLLRIAFGGTIFILFTNFFVSALQAKNEFLKASIVNLSSNIARLLLLILGIYFAWAGLYFLTLLFFLVPIVSILFGRYYFSFSFKNSENNLKKEYFKYNFWIAMALILSSIPFDNYFLLKIAGPIQTGLYAAPFKILTFAYQFGGNFTRVLASRFSSFDTDQKAINFSLKTALVPAFFSLGLLLLMLFSPLLHLLIGQQYAASSQVLVILSIGFIFFFFSTIVSSLILYYFGESNISFLITVIRYLIFITLLIILIPNQQALGAAKAFSLTEFIALCLMFAYVLLKFKKIL